MAHVSWDPFTEQLKFWHSEQNATSDWLRDYRIFILQYCVICGLKKEISQVETVSTSFEPDTLWNEKFKYLAQSKFILVCLLSYAFVQN